jgi:NAD-dependent protein deacetylase/lipoamidase
MSTVDGNALTASIRRLRHASCVLAVTGAGISAESGVPTFRDAQTGLWARYSPEDLATAAAFERDPVLVWQWYAWRRQLVRAASPNDGHRAIAVLESILPIFAVATQNVDGMHQRAGSRHVIELHGNIERTLCSRERIAFDDGGGLADAPPLCPRCGAPGRPAVVWFGEALPPDAIERASTAADTCDVLLSVGTSSLVYPAASLAETALRRGAFVIEVNPAPTPLSARADAVLSGAAGKVLPMLVEALR